MYEGLVVRLTVHFCHRAKAGEHSCGESFRFQAFESPSLSRAVFYDYDVVQYAYDVLVFLSESEHYAKGMENVRVPPSSVAPAYASTAIWIAVSKLAINAIPI